MKNTKQIGVWMDHSSAHLIPSANAEIDHEVIHSAFTHEKKEQSLQKGESHMHNSEQQLQHAYYGKLSDSLAPYQEILLFGPTEAKTELLHLLQKDHRFLSSKMDTKTCDKLTTGQQTAFVKKHFGIH